MSSSNILLIFGEDQPRVLAQVRKLTAQFCEKHGEHNFEKIWSDDLPSATPLLHSLETLPFIGKKRLVVLRDPWGTRATAWRRDLADFLEKIPSSTVLVAAETGKPDKREALFKKLQKLARVLEFSQPQPAELAQRAQTQAQAAGAQLGAQAASFLVERVGNDAARLENEIQKLVLAAAGSEITRENIVELVPPADALANIFALTDALGARQLPRALTELQNLLVGGESEFYLLAALAGHFRNLLLVTDFLEQNPQAAARAATELKLHPFVAKKALAQARNFDLGRLRQIYGRLADLDVSLKTGAKNDARLELERLCIMICEK